MRHLLHSAYFVIFSAISIVFTGTTILAQSNEEYSFIQQFVEDGGRYSDEDPFVNMSVECLAANGYGQWTMTSNPGAGSSFPAGWYLWGNDLLKPSTKFDPSDPVHHPGCRPPGMVAFGPFSDGVPAHVKVAANLSTSVRYVSISSDRNSFVVQGFDGGGLHPTPGADFDITLSGIPNGPGSRNIIKQSIHSFTVSTATNGNNHTIFSEVDFRDDFDIAIDGDYLYITWCSNVNSTTPGSKEVWATVIKLGAGTTVNGFPRSIGLGERPTIAADIRYATKNLSNVPPRFDVGYITQVPGGVVMHKTWTGAVLITNPLLQSFHNPNAVGTFNFINPTHVRALRSSVPGQATVSAMYAIVDVTSTHLVLYRDIPGPGSNVANYVDGLFLNHSLPVPQPHQGDPLAHVLDKPIIAFANPYDNQIGNFNQFHCLYQLVAIQDANDVAHPLMIVRGHDNGKTNPSTPIDTRLCLNQSLGNQLLPNPVSDRYVGAVNQMGVHVHWRANIPGLGNTHFYSRDFNRTFDENIEEHTIVTGTCRVSDGTSHGGTVGANLIRTGKMLLWTDPNYGAVNDPTFLSGLYRRRPPAPLSANNGADFFEPGVAKLEFHNANAKLSIGDASTHIEPNGMLAYHQATLTVMPYFYTQFTSTNQSIQVNPNSVFDYYGFSSQPGVVSKYSPFRGSGTIKLQGAVVTNSVIGPLTNHAYLKIRGGADFHTDDDIDFFSEKGSIECLFEPNIWPLNIPLLVNPPTTGMATLRGETVIDNSWVKGNLPDDQSGVIMHIEEGYYKTGVQFHLASSSLVNQITGGASIIRFGDPGDPKIYRDVEILENYFSGFVIHGFKPEHPFRVEENVFYEMSGSCVLLERPSPSIVTTYQDVRIIGNQFNNFANPIALNEWFVPIRIKNFNGDGAQSEVVVENNIFDQHDNYDIVFANTHLGGVKAILFENTNGNILSNYISDDVFAWGIEVASDIDIRTKSLICGNEIVGLKPRGNEGFAAAIAVTRHDGIVQSNILAQNALAFLAYNADRSRLLLNSISESEFCAIWLWNSNDTRVDLSGNHGSTISGDDVGGFNTISGECSASRFGLIAVEDGSEIVIGNKYEAWNWTEYGENNLFCIPLSGGVYPIIDGDVTGANTPLALGDINWNFWGTNIDPGSDNGVDPHNWNTINTSEVNALNITYTANTAKTRTSMISAPEVSCGTLELRSKDRKRSSVPPLKLEISECQLLFNRGNAYHQNEEWQKTYDTLKHYVEVCPDHENVHSAFIMMHSAVQSFSSHDSLAFGKHRDWLKSIVLYPSKNPYYYCMAVYAIAGTYHSTNEMLAIVKYMIEEAGCDNTGLRKDYEDMRRRQYERWLLTDTAVNKLDTNLPSLDSLGLSLLRQHSNVTAPPSSKVRVLSAWIAPNPSYGTVELSLELSSPAQITVEAFDLLGNVVHSTKPANLYDRGRHDIQLDLHDLAAGQYYIRITTSAGESRTLSFVRK